MTLSDKPTKSERSEHIKRIRGYATTIADRIESGLSLEDWQQGFLRMVLRDSGAPNDHAGALRAWAGDFRPRRERGQAPSFSHIEAALAYVAERDNDRTHYKAMIVLQSVFGTTQRSLERAIWPMIPDACDYLEVPLETALWRDTPPP